MPSWWSSCGAASPSAKPYYAQAALVLDCDTLSDEEAVERIIHYLEGNE